MNQRAESNFTKTTEFAVVMRRKNTALVNPQATSHYSCNNPPKKLHPFDKPLDVWKWILRATVRPGEVVLDPFAGSGSCLEACVDLGISFYGIEIDETHYNTMIVRLQNAFVRKHPTKKVKFI
jgi:DNA modification methylase